MENIADFKKNHESFTILSGINSIKTDQYGYETTTNHLKRFYFSNKILGFSEGSYKFYSNNSTWDTSKAFVMNFSVVTPENHTNSFECIYPKGVP